MLHLISWPLLPEMQIFSVIDLKCMHGTKIKSFMEISQACKHTLEEFTTEELW